MNIEKVSEQDAGSISYFWTEKGNLKRCTSYNEWLVKYPNLMAKIEHHISIMEDADKMVSVIIEEIEEE